MDQPITKDDVFIRREGSTVKVLARCKGKLYGEFFENSEYTSLFTRRATSQLVDYVNEECFGIPRKSEVIDFDPALDGKKAQQN